MTTRRDIIRDNAVVALISSGTLAGENVFTPRTWPTSGANYPAIIVRTPATRRSSLGPNGAPSFKSVVMLTVVGRLDAGSEAEADELMRVLAEQIEMAILGNSQFTFESEIQQFVDTATDLKVSAEAKRYLAEVHCAFSCEVFEMFQPNIDAAGEQFPPRDQLQGIDIKADLRNVFDAVHTYATPTEPTYTPTAAPRTEGPDGRLEGAAQIDLPQ